MIACIMPLGIAFGGVCVTAPLMVVNVFTDKPTIAQIGASFLRIAGWSFPLTVLSMGISSLLRSTERVKLPLYASIAALITNFLVNWVLIFGRFGFPAMGVRGAAVGAVISSAVNVAVLYALTTRERHSLLLRLRDQLAWSRLFVKQFLTKSAPLIGHEMLYGIGLALINIVIGRQSESGIAAITVFRTLEGLIFAFFMGLVNASSVMVGKDVGAGNHRQAYLDTKRFAILAPAVTLSICLLILPARGWLLPLFNLGDEALGMVTWMLVIYTVTGTVRICTYVINGIFRAGGETVFGTILELSGMFLITVPAVFLGGMVWRLPFLAVFALIFSDDLLRLILELKYMRSGRWIKPVTPEGVDRLEAFLGELRGK